MRYHSTTFRLLIAGIILLLGMAAAHAQTRNRVDNRGKEFRIAFLHTNGDDEFPRLAIVVSSEVRTQGTITYLRSNRTVPVNIAPGVATWIDLDTLDVLLPDPGRQPISNVTVLAKFDDEVVLYGVNTQRWSSDVFLGLPNETLGGHYIVLSYPNTLAPDPTAIYTRNSDFPSQFAVIATEDGTQVDITPTVVIKSRPNDTPFRVTLNAGEIYFGQAAGKAGNDLTGTEIRANKPVVVYGSHQRANIPFDDAVGRDHLVEQLLPVEKWTSRAILNAHFQIPKTVADANIARIIAANDNTQLYIDSTFFRTLGAREMVEIPLDRTKLLTASAPIQVAQYQHTTVDERFMRVENDSIGDPFMMLAFGPEQYDSVYWFQSLPTKDFKYHYINVIIPTERISSFELDGGRYGASSFTRIEKTSYSIAQIQVSPGPHKARARAPFGLYVYGYGPYNSYGYPGAVVFDTLFKDQKQPDIRWRDTCFGAVGFAFDDSTNDFGIESLRLLEGSQNVRLELDKFTPGDDSVGFRLQLLDPYQDGYAQMIAVDTAGLDRHYNFRVKGFTVAMTVGQTTPVQLDTLASLNGMEFCRSITLRNYGQFPQQIVGLHFSGNPAGLRSSEQFPIDIQPGEERQLSICYQHAGDTSFSVEIGVDNGCFIRPVAIIPLISGIDSTAPNIGQITGPCDLDRVLGIDEPYALNSGVGAIEFLDSMNVEAIYTPPGLPSKNLELRLRRRNPYQDMIYSIVVTDVVGNRTAIADTVGGFTLAVRASGDTAQIGVRFNRMRRYPDLSYGESACDTFYLENYGLLPLPVQNPRILGNIEFSIPPDQLPLVLQPKQVVPLVICVRPNGSGDRIDTLAIDFNCGNPVELVQLYTAVEPLMGQGGDRCGNRMHFQVDGFAKRNFLETPAPNPASGMAKLTFGLTESQKVSLTIYDGRGGEIRRLLDNDQLPGGIASIDAAVDDLPAGMYYLRMETSTGTAIVEKLMISR